MFKRYRIRRRHVIVVFIVTITLHILGVFTHLFEKNFYTDFNYPYEGDVYAIVQQLKNNVTPNVPPINSYNYKFIKDCKEKCKNVEKIRLVYLVKTTPNSFRRREAIRKSWGFEKRFSDVEIKKVFLLGITANLNIQHLIDIEHEKNNDIVQADFEDSYFNNTIKIMIGFKWAMKFCQKSKFYMFVDEDYYVSTKNVLRFTRNPTNYPKYLQEPLYSMKNVLLRKTKQLEDFELPEDVRLYSGFVFVSSPHRHYFSKWYVTLEQYPYHMWPPYVTAGAIIISKASLIDMFYASFYTKHFKFDDIYVSLLALKTNIEPYHCNEFYFHKKPYNPKDYMYTIASHGFDDPNELVQVWTEQKSLGNA